MFHLLNFLISTSVTFKLRVPGVHEIFFVCFGDVSLCVILHPIDCGFCLRKSIQLHSSRSKEKSAVRRRGVCRLEIHREALPTASFPPRIEDGRAGDRPEFGWWRGCVRGRGGKLRTAPRAAPDLRILEHADICSAPLHSQCSWLLLPSAGCQPLHLQDGQQSTLTAPVFGPGTGPSPQHQEWVWYQTQTAGLQGPSETRITVDP